MALTKVQSEMAGVGQILQVVQGTYSTQGASNSTSYADTGLTATITPKFSTSKILILINHTNNARNSASSGNALFLNLCKNGSQIIEFVIEAGYTGTGLANYWDNTFMYLDSPATTSATTYKTQFKNGTTGGNVYVQANSNMSTITLMEVSA